MTDVQLLHRFVGGRDQAAFRSLVLRHGPAVLRACRALLRDHHEAEDAFQATFLVFVRRAPSIRDPERLGNWLIGVANRVALRARADSSRRRAREAQGVGMIADASPSDRPEPDLPAVLREEIGRLPAKYRAPLELCYLEGLTHEEAASRLGWPAGTVKVRLVRSRRLLRERLDRRGLLPAALLLALWPRPARAELPPGLVDSTVEAMRRAAAAPAYGPIPRRFGVRLGWPLLALLISVLLVAGANRMSSRKGAVDDDGAGHLPANLIDILNVRCR